MNDLETLLHRISGVFDEQMQPWAVVGGLAVSVRTEPRFTRDLDLAVAVSDDQKAEMLVHHLHGAGFRTFATVEHEVKKRLATARLAPFDSHAEGLVLDVLFASSGIEKEICAEAENLVVFPNLCVPVAKIHHLMALKALSRDDRTRPQDAADLKQLIVAAETFDFATACDAARLIEMRGYNRDKDLVKALNDAWHDFRD